MLIDTIVLVTLFIIIYTSICLFENSWTILKERSYAFLRNRCIGFQVGAVLMILPSLCLTSTYVSFICSVQAAIRKLSQNQEGSVLCACHVPWRNVVCFSSAGIVRESGRGILHQHSPAHWQTVLSGLLCSPTNASLMPTVQQWDAPILGPVLNAMCCSHTMDKAVPTSNAHSATQVSASAVFAEDAFPLVWLNLSYLWEDMSY